MSLPHDLAHIRPSTGLSEANPEGDSVGVYGDSSNVFHSFLLKNGGSRRSILPAQSSVRQPGSIQAV